MFLIDDYGSQWKHWLVSFLFLLKDSVDWEEFHPCDYVNATKKGRGGLFILCLISTQWLQKDLELRICLSCLFYLTGFLFIRKAEDFSIRKDASQLWVFDHHQERC